MLLTSLLLLLLLVTNEPDESVRDKVTEPAQSTVQQP
jgi:hypothetical protein